jgi:hypothetical protein
MRERESDRARELHLEQIKVTENPTIDVSG